MQIITKQIVPINKSADPEAVIIPYETKIKRLEEEGEEVYLCPRKDCTDHLSKLQRLITQLHKYFPKGKLKRSSGAIFTNCLILRAEEIEDIVIDMKDGMSSCNAKISKQRVQYYDAVKLGCIMCITTKIETRRQTEFFVEKIEEKLDEKLLIALSISKINDGTNFSRKKKVEYQGVHVETIKSQQIKVKRALYEILKKIPAQIHDMELRFMLQMRHSIDSKQNNNCARTNTMCVRMHRRCCI